MLPAPFDVLPLSAWREFRLSKGHALFRQGEPTRGLFFLKSGRVNLVRMTSHGDDVIIHRAHSGELFAEASLFTDHYHCDAVIDANAELIEVQRRAVLTRLRVDSAFAVALTGAFASQIQFYRRQLELRAIRSAEERVLAAMTDGLLNSDIKTFAVQIGLTHEAAYRALASLVKQGRVHKRGRGLYFLPHP